MRTLGIWIMAGLLVASSATAATIGPSAADVRPLTHTSSDINGTKATTDECGTVKPGDVCYYPLDLSSVNSSIFRVEQYASFCWIKDLNATVGSSVAIVWWRVVAPTATTTAHYRSLTPSGSQIVNPLRDTNTDCQLVGPGWYYFDIKSTTDTPPAAIPTGAQKPGIMVLGIGWGD